MIYSDAHNARFVPHLVTGDTADAEAWNLLYGEMDKRVGSASNGKSILFLNTKEVNEASYYAGGYTMEYWEMFRGKGTAKINDDPNSERGVIGDRQFYFISGAVTGDDGEYPYTVPECKRCADNNWSIFGYASETECQEINCNFSLTDNAGWYWKLWGKYFLENQSHVNWLYKHEYFEETVSGSYVIDISEERNLAVVVEAVNYYTRGRGRETPIFEVVTNRGSTATRFDETGLFEFNSQATCPQSPFLYCQNLDNSLAVHVLRDDHPKEFISINCIPSGSASGLSGVDLGTGFGGGGGSGASGAGVCPQCDGAEWMIDPFGFYSEAECEIYYSCSGSEASGGVETGYIDVCPSGVTPDSLSLSGKRIISYGNWNYSSELGWAQDKIFNIGSEEKIIPMDGEYILQSNLNSENRTSQAELFFDGYKSEYEDFTFPVKYNKYKFFRIHNLNHYDMKFTFESELPDDVTGLGSDGLFGNDGKSGDVYAVSECAAGTGLSFTIKAGESRCVRRDFGTYTTGFHHFQKFMRGDAKYNLQLGLMGSTTAAYPLYSNPYVKSEESNWRDYTNSANNPFILGRYFHILNLDNRLVLDETWPKTWDGYHTYVDTENKEASPEKLAFTGYLPWSHLKQPRQYDFKDFNPYNPKTLLADLIYTTGYALRSVSIKSGMVETNPYAGTTAGFADVSLFAIDPDVQQVETAVNLSLIPYSGARHLEQFLHQLGVNIFPHDPNVGFTTPRSHYGQQVAFFGHGWSGMFAGPRRMLAGEDVWYEPREMFGPVCTASSPGADIGLRCMLDEEQKSRGVSVVEEEYKFLDVEGRAAGLPSVLDATKGSLLTGFYGWKLGYGGTWERYSKDKVTRQFSSGVSGDDSVSGSGDSVIGVTYIGGYRVGDGTGDGEYIYLEGDKNNNPDNISCISGMRKKLFSNWYLGDGDWFDRTSTNLDPPDPFAYQIQAMPVSTNIFGRDNAFNNIMQLYPLARKRLDPACLCHEQYVVPMIDTIFGHNINIGDYYYQVTPKLQTRRGDTIDLAYNDHVMFGEDERKARHIFTDNEYYDPLNAGWSNHYRYLHRVSGPIGGGGQGDNFLSKCYPYYAADFALGFGGEYPVFSGTRYNKSGHTELWDPATDSENEIDHPHCPVFVDLTPTESVHSEGDTYKIYNTVTGRPMDLVEVTPYYLPVMYADPVPWRFFHGFGPMNSRWVGLDGGCDACATPLRTRTLHELEIMKRCHACGTEYDSEGDVCVCGDGYADVMYFHVLPDILGASDYAGHGGISTYAKSTYTPVHIDYLDLTHRYRTFKAIDNAIMPIQFKKYRDLLFDYDSGLNPDQLTDGPENHRSFFSTTIYDVQEVFGEFNKIEGQWTGYRSMFDGKWSWDYSSFIPKSTKAVDYDPIMRLTRPGPHYGGLLKQVGVPSGSPTGGVEDYGFHFARDASGKNFNRNLKEFMDPSVIAMGEADPFRYDETGGGIGYTNIRFADNASIKYDFQKNINLYSLNREPIYSFGDPSRGNAFAEGMVVDPDVSGYPDGTPILRSRHAFGLDKHNEMTCNRPAVIAGRGDNSYLTRGATNTLDGGYLNIYFRNGLSTFYQSNRSPEYYSAMLPASDNHYNSGIFGQNLLAESGYKYLHPDVFSSEHIKEIRHGKVKNTPVGGWNKENLFEKKIFGFPRFFQWMDNFPSQVDVQGDYLDVPTNYGEDIILSQFGPPMGIYVLEQSCDEIEYGSGCNGFDLRRLGEDESGNAINEEYKGIISLPEGDGYWAECTGYYNQMIIGATTQEDHDNFGPYCPSIKIRDWLLRTGDPFFFQINPYCDGPTELNESWVAAYPYMETGVSGYGVIKGGVVVGTGVWYMFPPKIDLVQPAKSGAPSDSFTPSWSSSPVSADANHPSGKGANVYPYFSGYPNVPWVESLCISGIVTQTTADGATYNQTSNLYLDYFITNQFGERRMDKYPCYGDVMPTCPHDVLVEL